jgi:hypothetical protein
MQINAIRKVMSLAAVLAVVAGTTAAHAQSQTEGGVSGSFDQPLKTVQMTETDDEHTYTIKIDGDDVSAEVDGKAVPKDRVRSRNGRVEILDENKEVIKTFNVRPTTSFYASPRFRVETLQRRSSRASKALVATLKRAAGTSGSLSHPRP